MLRHFAKFVVASLLACLCQPALAQSDPFGRNELGTISGTGVIAFRPKATVLRLHLVLMKEGDDMPATLKALDQLGENFRKALLKANAGTDSIKIDEPRLMGRLHALGELIPIEQVPMYQGKGKGKGGWAQQTPPQQYPPPSNVNPPPQQQNSPAAVPRRPHPAENEVKRAPRIHVEAPLRAEWPLHGQTTAELLVEADRIVLQAHEQIKDLLPKKVLPSYRPSYSKGKGEDEEPFDSDEEQSDQPVEVLEPEYVFVGTISAEQLDKSRIEAFKQAMVHAEATAKIAGLQIGTLQDFSVSDRGAGGRGDPSDPFAPSSMYLTPSPILPGAPLGGPRGTVSIREFFGPQEVVGFEPLSLHYSISVSATYRLIDPARSAKTSKTP
jgi:hypothetical protein